MPVDLPPLVDVVTVEAARLPPSPADKAFSIVTIDGEAIATAPRLDEALTSTPGVQLFRRTSSQASNPTTQGISVRSIAGSGASRALVTLDGVPQNDPFGGWVLWTGLPTIAVEQARIVRGAGAGPYGAGALTGTIQLSERTRAPRGGEYEVYGGERAAGPGASDGADADPLGRRVGGLTGGPAEQLHPWGRGQRLVQARRGGDGLAVDGDDRERLVGRRRRQSGGFDHDGVDERRKV